MPYIFDPNLNKQDEEENQGELKISGASTTVDSGGNQKQGALQAAPNTGSGFQNLDKYLATNQSQNLGGQVAGRVQNSVDQALQNQNLASQSFSQKVQSANETPKTETVTSVLDNPFQADKNKFQTWMNQSYTAPKSLAESQNDYSQFWGGQQKAATEAKMLGSEAGRFSLLDNYFGKPQYSYGQKSLDNLLVQQSPDRSRDLQSQAAQLKARGTSETQRLQNEAAMRAAEIDRSKENLRGQVDTRFEDRRNQVLSQVESENLQREAEKKAFQEKLNYLKNYSGNRSTPTSIYYNPEVYSPEEIEKMTAAQNAANTPTQEYTRNLQDVINQFGASDVYNNLNEYEKQKFADQLIKNSDQYIKYNDPLNVNQVMTPEQRAYLQALSQLSGVDDTFSQGIPEEKSKILDFDLNRFLNSIPGYAPRAQTTSPTDINSFIPTNPYDWMR